MKTLFLSFFICFILVCSHACDTDDDCRYNILTCQQGKCVPQACADAGDCPTGTGCFNGECWKNLKQKQRFEKFESRHKKVRNIVN